VLNLEEKQDLLEVGRVILAVAVRYQVLVDLGQLRIEIDLHRVLGKGLPYHFVVASHEKEATIDVSKLDAL